MNRFAKLALVALTGLAVISSSMAQDMAQQKKAKGPAHHAMMKHHSKMKHHKMMKRHSKMKHHSMSGHGMMKKTPPKK